MAQYQPFSQLGQFPSENDCLAAIQQSGIDSTIDLSRIEDIYPATPFQKGVLHTSMKSRPPGRFFSIVYTILLPPHTNVARFHDAYQSLTDAHSILRTGFCVVAPDVLSIVHKPESAPQYAWTEVVQDGLEQTGMQASGLQFVYTHAFEPFSGRPLHAVHVVGSPAAGYRVHFAWHHAIVDGAIVVDWLKTLHALYHNRVSPLSLANTQYALVAKALNDVPAQNSVAMDEAKAYWRATMETVQDGLWPPPPPAHKHDSVEPLSAATIFRQCAVPTSSRPERTRPAFSSRVVRAALALAMSLHSGLGDQVFTETRSSKALLPEDLQSIPGPALSAQLTRLSCDKDTNLADLLMMAGNQKETERVLRKAPMALGQIMEAIGRSAAAKIRVFLVVYAKPFWLGDEDIPGWNFVVSILSPGEMQDSNKPFHRTTGRTMTHLWK